MLREVGLSVVLDIGQVNQLFSKVSKDFNNMVLAIDLKLDRAEFADSVSAITAPIHTVCFTGRLQNEQRDERIRAAINDKDLEVAQHSHSIDTLKSSVLTLEKGMVQKCESSALQRGLLACRDDINKGRIHSLRLQRSELSSLQL